MSEPIKWAELDPDERSWMVAEHVLHVTIPVPVMMRPETSCARDLRSAWNLATWFVDQRPGSYFEARRESKKCHVQICLYSENNLDMPIQRYNAHGYDLADVLCVALLRAAGVEVNDEPL